MADTPADSMTLPERLRALGDHMEEGCKQNLTAMPVEELNTTLKMVQDFRAAADSLEMMESLLEDIAENEPTNGVGGLARDALDTFAKTASAPVGTTMEWLAEAQG